VDLHMWTSAVISLGDPGCTPICNSHRENYWHFMFRSRMVYKVVNVTWYAQLYLRLEMSEGLIWFHPPVSCCSEDLFKACQRKDDVKYCLDFVRGNSLYLWAQRLPSVLLLFLCLDPGCSSRRRYQTILHKFYFHSN